MDVESMKELEIAVRSRAHSYVVKSLTELSDGVLKYVSDNTPEVIGKMETRLVLQYALNRYIGTSDAYAKNEELTEGVINRVTRIIANSVSVAAIEKVAKETLDGEFE